MRYPKDADANAKAEAVEVAYALSSGGAAGIPFAKGKMKIPAIVWRYPIKSQEEDECPKGNNRTFCANCGGNALKDVNEVNFIGRCKGVKNGAELSLEAYVDYQQLFAMKAAHLVTLGANVFKIRGSLLIQWMKPR